MSKRHIFLPPNQTANAAMRDHHALGIPGRAGGIDNIGAVFCADPGMRIVLKDAQRRSIWCRFQWQGDRLLGQRCCLFLKCGLADNRLRLDGRYDRLAVLIWRCRIKWYKRGTQGHNSQLRRDRFNAAPRQNTHKVALTDARGLKRLRDRASQTG